VVRLSLALLLAAAPLAAQQHADTLPPAAAVESPFVAKAAGFTLYGTLTLPRNAAGPVPVALIIAGSGPTDRNANSPVGIRSNTYAQLAWRLAEHGIATLRYDKRGIAQSRAGFDTVMLAHATMQLYADDVHALADSLHADRRFSKVILVGHSEGSALALIAANDKAPVAGVVSMAGMGRPFAAVLREQLAAQLDSGAMQMFDTSMTAYLAGRNPPVPAYLQSLFVPLNRSYMKSMMDFDATQVSRVPCPVLIVQGDMDLQVAVADAQALKGARPAAQLMVLPGDNHMFKVVPSRDRTAQMPAYLDPTLPIDPALVNALTTWIGGLK